MQKPTQNRKSAFQRRYFAHVFGRETFFGNLFWKNDWCEHVCKVQPWLYILLRFYSIFLVAAERASNPQNPKNIHFEHFLLRKGTFCRILYYFFPKHRFSDWGSDFTMIVNPASCQMASGIFPQRFSMFFVSSLSLRFGTTFGEGDRFYSSLAHSFLQNTVFVERNEARNREPQKSAVL